MPTDTTIAKTPHGGVRHAMSDAANWTIESKILGAIVRWAILTCLPLILGMMSWFALNFIEMRQTTATQASEQARIVAQVLALEEYRRDAFARGAAMIERVATIQKTLDRIEERQNRRAAP